MICMIRMLMQSKIEINKYTADIINALNNALLLIAKIYLLLFSKWTILLIKLVIFNINSNGPKLLDLYIILLWFPGTVSLT